MAAIWKPSWERAWKIVTDFDLEFTREVYYDPLHFLSLMSDQVLVRSLEPNAGIAKVMNVVYHVINSVLVFAFLLMTGTGRRAAFIGALVFAAHPIQVGTVAWIAERKNVLSTLFYLSSMILFLKYLSRGSSKYLAAGQLNDVGARHASPTGDPADPRDVAPTRDASRIQSLDPGTSAGWHYLFFVAILFVLGLLSKPSTVTLPAALLCLVFVCYREMLKDRGVVYVLTALFLLALAWGGYVLSTERTYSSILPPLQYRPLVTAGAIWFYLGKFLAPLQLAPLYPRWDVVENPGWFALGLVALMALGSVLVYFRKGLDKWIVWGMLFFLINLAMVSGLIPFGYMSNSFVADHFLYLPMVGLALIVARCIHLFGRDFGFETLPGKIAIVGLYLWVAVLGLLSVKQTMLWRDPASVWEATLEINKTSVAAYNNYGLLCIERGDFKKAINMFRKAAELAPDFDKPYHNMGWAYRLMGDDESAKKMYEKAIELDPNAELPRRMLGQILDRHGRYDEAIETFKGALKANPKSGSVYNDMGLSYYRSGREEDALRAFDKAIEVTPFYPDPYVHKATALLSRGNADGAIPLLQQAIKLASSAQAHNVLGAAYAHKRDYARALDQFVTAYRLRADFPGIRDNVANAMMDLNNYAAAARFCSESAAKGLPCSAGTVSRISERTP
ncbi:MAG: tetratricopeptide repeat protein [Desulfomonile tiedjei]|nr:tetratricopeptide repeat protein [Desulfomonile tiedjei]